MSVATGTPILRIATGPLAGKVFEFQTTLRVGRHPFNEMSLGDPGVSRYHCWILFRDGVPAVEDLASANGTFVNGERVRARRTLKPGDVVRVGSTEFRVADEAA
jgi:ABC transport system ATP-binding/permease protein